MFKANMTTVYKNFKRDQNLLLILLPAIIFYIIFCYIPMYGVIIAFKNFNISQGILGSSWAGLKYFKELFASYYFPRLLTNTLTISVEQLFWGFPIPIIFALMLNEIKNNAFKRVVQTCSYLPHFISLVVIVGLMVDFLSQNGVANQLLNHFGVQSISFFNEPSWFRTLYVGSGVWQEFGWNSIIYLAAITSVNPELYESAIIDGAGKFKQMLYITLPCIAPTIIILLILNMGWMLNVGYEKIILMYNPATYNTADVFSTYVYRRGLQDAQYSFGAAVGLANSIVNITILLTVNFISKKTTKISIF